MRGTGWHPAQNQACEARDGHRDCATKPHGHKCGTVGRRLTGLAAARVAAGLVRPEWLPKPHFERLAAWCHRQNRVSFLATKTNHKRRWSVLRVVAERSQFRRQETDVIGFGRADRQWRWAGVETGGGSGRPGHRGNCVGRRTGGAIASATRGGRRLGCWGRRLLRPFGGCQRRRSSGRRAETGSPGNARAACRWRNPPP